MKILIDLTSLADNLSGIERFAICIARELIEYRDKKYILVFKNSIHPSFLRFNEDENVKIIVLKGKNKLLFNQVILPWNLYKFSADIYLFLAFPAPWLLFKRNVISTVHDIVCWDCPNTMKFLSEVYFKLSTITATRFGSRVITISKFSKRRMQLVPCFCII